VALAPISTTPLGAFNGTGPISQFSPIVKETPGKKVMGLGLRASGLSEGGGDRDVESRRSSVGGIGLGLSEENMRIAKFGAGFDRESRSRGGKSKTGGVSPVIMEQPTARKMSHQRDANRDEGIREEESEDFDDAKSGVSSLHEMERFDFDHWEGDGRRFSRDSDRGRVSPIVRERDSFSLDFR
jgi:hypothetical protein